MKKEEGDGYLPSIAWIEDEIYALRLKGIWFFLNGIGELGQEEEIGERKNEESGSFPY